MTEGVVLLTIGLGAPGKRPDFPGLSRSLLLVFVFALLAVCGCAGHAPKPPLEPLTLTAGHGLVLRRLTAPPFSLLALAPETATGPVLRVYLEGDGRAWLTTNRLSPDPTPTNPLVLELLMADSFPDKAYLARPCQYGRTEVCQPIYWSERRFSPEAVASMNQALDELKAAGGYQSLELVGYSGGGTMAALLAARRDDVVFLRTVAGNLDHVWLNKHHRLSPLAGSLNPPDFAARLAGIPQRHFFGAADRIVPAGVYQAYAGAFADRSCLAMSLIPEAEHGSGWREKWPACIAQPPGCLK